jgi:hypothetical protein
MGYGQAPGTWTGANRPVAVDPATSPLAEAPPPGPIGLNGSSGAAPAPSTQSIADRIVSFARQRLTHRVGDGQCYALADRALSGAGAKSAPDHGEITPDADYVWGRSVTLSQLQPGDVIQFRDYEFTRTVVTETSSGTTTTEAAGDRPHHTAIVERVGPQGEVTVLEQNVPPGTPVARNTLYFSAGTTKDGGTTTTVTLTGRWWFYRPEAR